MHYLRHTTNEGRLSPDRLFTRAGGFVGKLTTNVFAIPILFAGGCFLYYLNERRTIGTVIAAGGADASAYRTATVSLQQNIFFCTNSTHSVSLSI